MQKAVSEPKEADRKCLCCGRTIRELQKSRDTEGLGIKSYSHYYRQYGALPWCRDCAIEMYKHFVNLYQSRKVALFYWCVRADFPFIEKVIPADDVEVEDYLQKYLSDAKRMYSSKAKAAFLGSDYFSEKDMPTEVEAEVVPSPIIDYTEDKSNSLYIKWGRNPHYTPADYQDLEEIYHSIANQNGIITDEKTGEVVDKVTEIAVIEAASYLLHARKARNKGDADDAKKYFDLYDKAMGSQLLRGKDIKDKQVGDVLVQDIVKYIEQDGFIEPWDRKVKYPHKKDVVDQVLLHIMNYVGKLTADIFNKHVSKLEKTPTEYKLKYGNDEFPTEETDFDKLYDKNMEEIADFKARQHISDDEADEDSADLDEDNDSDAALLGEDGD